MNASHITSAMNIDLLNETNPTAALELYMLAVGVTSSLSEESMKTIKQLELVDHKGDPHDAVKVVLTRLYTLKEGKLVSK